MIMKQLLFFLIPLAGTLCFGQNNGLYSCTGSKNGTEVITVDSQALHINLKKKIDITRAFVFSMNNENTDFYVELITPKISNKEWPVLLVDGKYYRSTGKGSGADVYSVSFMVNREQANEISKALNVPCNLRKHFGHALDFQFEPVKDDYKAGDSVYVKFKITNASDVTVWYNKGGMYRNSNGRCDYFDFEIYYNDILLPDEGPQMNFGGREYVFELGPNQTDSLTECITKWTPFTKPGKYKVKCIYRLHLKNENNFTDYPDNQNDLHKAWDEKAEKTIEITIKE